MGSREYLTTTVWLNVEPLYTRSNLNGIRVESLRKTRPKDGGLWIKVKLNVDPVVFASRLEAVLTVDMEEQIEVVQTFAVPGTGQVDEYEAEMSEFKGDGMDGASDY